MKEQLGVDKVVFAILIERCGVWDDDDNLLGKHLVRKFWMAGASSASSTVCGNCLTSHQP